MAVEEIEKRVHQVMEQLHKLPDLERLAELGIEEKLKTGIRLVRLMKMKS